MILTLTTDFGTRDTFVAQMKGVLLSRAPQLSIVDVTHDIAAQDILAGALALESLIGLFPAGSIHVAIVDPGVGSSRRAVAIRTGRAVLIGPDNGLFSFYLGREPALEAVELSNQSLHRTPVSATFHGRDIFSSAAGHFAAGTAFDCLGHPVEVDSLIRISNPGVISGNVAVYAKVIAIDRFGNLVTSATLGDMKGADPESLRICVADQAIVGLKRTYAQVQRLEPVAYVGSGGRIEIGLRDANAFRLWGVKVGAEVRFIITT